MPSISKILKKAILIQLTEYLNNNNILLENQLVYNNYVKIDANYSYSYFYSNEILLNYIDTSKAFDTLDHII